MSRPDAKKNITTLVEAFGSDPMLRQLANLVLIMVSLARFPLRRMDGQTLTVLKSTPG
jgi:sucrose-phosphate synthase